MLNTTVHSYFVDFINEQALNEPDVPDVVPHVPGTLRGRKWNPPSKPKPVYDDDIEISLDLGEDVEVALSSATTEEIVDLAGTVPSTYCSRAMPYNPDPLIFFMRSRFKNAGLDFA
jgi:hypothetical protein